MLTVYGIPSCDTCRRANKYLTDNGIEFQFHDLRADGLNVQMLERWSDRLGSGSISCISRGRDIDGT